MYPFVESLKFVNHQFFNLEYHQARFDSTRNLYYPSSEKISLSDILRIPENIVPDQVYKCRIVYGELVDEVIFEPYTPRQISRFYLVVCPDEFDYSSKLTDRSFFDRARAKLKPDEDFIYIKKGLITDTSFANLVFTDGNQLVTPSEPLLRGTKRAYYLDKGLISEKILRVQDIRDYTGFYVINAMLDLKDLPEFSCSNLLLSHNHLKL
jgi:4-amino-4-deoxychorismate lyase